MKKFVGLLILLFFLFFCIKSECPDHIWTNENEILVYSTQTSTYINAENQCTTYGGKIVRIPNEDRSLFNQIVEELYLQGLVEVKIYNETNVHGNPNENPQRIYDYHKYRADGYSDDEESLDGYDRPGIGDLSSIRLSQNSQPDKSIQVQFCYTASRDLVTRVCPGGGWIFNFKLYEETNQSENTIMLYNYYAEYQGATSTFSLVPIVGSYWTTNYAGGLTFVYIKDISVFIGARSDVNQTKWYWNNITEVNNTMFPESNSSVCQQMTWPLTYNDGINLRPKQCETGMSHYLCRVNFSINVDKVVCNATSLNVSWNSLSQLFQDSSNVVGDLQIKLQTELSTITFEINLNQSNVILNGLDQRQEYSIDVSLQIKNCPTFQLAASSSGRTGYGIPDQVTSAYVDNTYNQCKVIWKHKTTDTEIQSYEIHIDRDSGNTSVISYDIINDVELQSFQVDFNNFNYNTTLNFSILAITACQMKSVIQTVNGTCTTPPSPTTANTGLLIGIGVGVGCLLILIILLLVYVRNKNTKLLPTKPNEFETNSCTHIIQPAMQENPIYDSYQLQTYENNEQELSIGERKSNSDDQDATEYEVIKSSIYSIARKELEKKFTEESSKSFPKFFAQFQKLKELALKNEKKHDLATANKKLNRYKNVYSYDHALVALKGNKYINASFIQGFENPKQYIATQGPKPNTISDFWEMVWLQESHIIIMLCKCTEKNKSKCEAYWPLTTSPITFEHSIVVLKKAHKIDDITKRIIVLKKKESQEERTVVQYQYTGWPDHDVPCTTSSMTKLRHLVNKEHSAMKSNAPIIVHCSAGAGRTGTYIAIDNLINEINQTQHIDAFNAVLNMRRNRKDMVQNLSQYIFIHKVVAESLILPATEIDVDQFPDTIQNKSWIDKHSSKEFPLLSNPVVTSSVSLKSIQSDVESEYANIKLTTRKDEHQVPVFIDGHRRMMDAHFIQIPCLSSSTIVAAEPNSENEILFWEMILQRNIRCVVGLEENYLTSKLKKEGEVVSFKQTKVIVESVEETSSLLHSNITIHSDKTAHHLTHITTKDIQKEKLLNVKSCLEVYEKIKLISDSCLMIYCKDGCRISGLFLTLMMSIEQIKAEDKIDLFRTVKDLKDYRPSLIGNENDYKACYKLVDEYMKYCSEKTSASIYQNI